MMRPPGGVIVGPEARVDLRNDDLLVLRANFVDLVAQQRGGVDAVDTDFNFLATVARNHLVGVDRMLELGRVTCDSQESQSDRNDIVREGRHLAYIFKRELIALS